MKNSQITLRANITAVGKYTPENIITNYDFEKNIDTSHDWIVSRTGIKERRKVSKGETSPLVINNGTDNSSEYDNYQIEVYMNEVNRRVDFIIKE